jgi:hypothetical protein
MATCEVVNWFNVCIDRKKKESERVFSKQQVQIRPGPLNSTLGSSWGERGAVGNAVWFQHQMSLWMS